MKTTLQHALATVAPSIRIRTIWEHDLDAGDPRKDGDWLEENANPDDWQAWQSEIRATCIINGDEVTGSAYLGGTWEKSGDYPGESNPTISGYENEMTMEALEELESHVTDDATLAQIQAAIGRCKKEAQRIIDAIP